MQNGNLVTGDALDLDACFSEQHGLTGQANIQAQAQRVSRARKWLYLRALRRIERAGLIQELPLQQAQIYQLYFKRAIPVKLVAKQLGVKQPTVSKQIKVIREKVQAWTRLVGGLWVNQL